MLAVTVGALAAVALLCAASFYVYGMFTEEWIGEDADDLRMYMQRRAERLNGTKDECS